jgi:serine O-acetyltransferase
MLNKKNIELLLKSYKTKGFINRLETDNLPARKSINIILNQLKEILFPGYFETLHLDSNNLEYIIGQKVFSVSDLLYTECLKSICWECKHDPNKCHNQKDCQQKTNEIVRAFINHLPSLRDELILDAKAIFKGDPAAKSEAEIILSYPGFQAITAHRIAHFFYQNQIPLIPRLMSEIIHGTTGIDIHPGAQIGQEFCIDHGTGIVIGETAIIGHKVKLYQGVTIGALSVSKNLQGKRHPTIEDNVTIYARTTILGGDTIIGKNSIIGGNVWLVSSVPANSKIYLKNNQQILKSS